MNLWSYVKRYRGRFFLCLFLAAINQSFSLLTPIIFQLIIDRYATNASNLGLHAFLTGAGVLVLGIVSTAFVSRIAKAFQDYYVSDISQRVSTNLYADAIDRTLGLPYAIFEDRQSGELLQKLLKAKQDVAQMLKSLVNVLFIGGVGILFVVVYAFIVHWMVGLAYALLIPIMGGLAHYISKGIKEQQAEIVRETGSLAGSTTETLKNVSLVKSLGLEEQEVKRLNLVNDEILRLELKKVTSLRKLSFIQGTSVNAVRMLLLMLMLYLLYTGGLSLGELMSLYFFSFFIFSPLSNLGEALGDYQQGIASSQSIQDLYDIPREKRPDKKLETLKSAEFKDVSFSYAKTPTLKKISFALTSGETIAFAGASGSGKTTIIKLLVGLYKPKAGKILFNGKENVEVRSRIGLVAQDAQLFAGTIRENLLFVNPQASDKQCKQALKDAAVDHLGTLNTKIGEGGLKLSGGERQRLAIARALLRDPDLLIFDEATSSLDSASEKKILKTLEGIRAARPHLMVVMIAHRLSTITGANRIHVLENGKIAESGEHKQLLAKKGLYAAFWREQEK